jgi:uncharacterized membrane protein
MSWNPTPGQDPNQPGQYPGYTPQPGPGAYGGTPPSGTGYGQQPYSQPPYGQQPYGQQPYGAPGAAASALGPTSMGMDANVAAGLSYLFGWLTGLIIFLVEKQNRFVRFHAMQSIITFGALTVFWIVVQFVLQFIPFIGLLACFLSPFIGLLSLVLWVVLMVMAFQGRYWKLPVIGDYAERYANPSPGMPGL